MTVFTSGVSAPEIGPFIARRPATVSRQERVRTSDGAAMGQRREKGAEGAQLRIDADGGGDAVPVIG